MNKATPVLNLEGISKRFFGVAALRDVNLVLEPGTIHAIVGENGAGKSTLINIATGVLQPDEGVIRLHGEPVRIGNPREAARMGIHVVHQEAELFGQISLAENMLLSDGLERRKGIPWLVDWPRTYGKARDALKAMDASGDVTAPAGTLSIGRRVLASISAAVSRSPKVLFLDEPTASLTHGETRRLIDQLHRLKAAGVAIVYVSHRLDEVLEISDTVTTLRDGRWISTESAEGLTADDLISRMVGRQIDGFQRQATTEAREPVFRLKGLSSPDGHFRDVTLEVRRGEILGVYGLVGAGRSELARAIFGLDPYTGEVELNGKSLHIHRPAAAMKAGLAYLPEDRLNEGIFSTHSCATNVTVAALRNMGSFGLISARKEGEAASRTIRDLQVKLDKPSQPINTLSGGNQQKLVLGRWMETQPELLILDEPTRGVDVGAKAQIHRLMGELADRGKSILMISSDLAEVMQASDRVLVLTEGRVAGEFDPRTATEDAIVAAALPTSTKRAENEAAHMRTSPLAKFRELGIVAAIALIVLLMAILKPGEFLSVKNLLDVLIAASIVSVGAAGMTLVIIAGGIDISVGRMLGLVATAAGLAAMAGLPPVLCLLLAMGMGAILAGLNSLLSTLGKVHPIIVTLAGMSIYFGLMLQLTQGKEVHPLPDAYRALVEGTILGFPKMLVWALAVLGGTWMLLQNTLLGRRMLAVGNSEKAASLIGIAPWRIRLISFAIMGALIGLCSVMWAGYYGKVQGNTGNGFELQVIAAAVVGGCSIMGGRGTALGTFFGAVMIALIRNCLVLLKIDSYWQDLFVGSLILLAVLVDVWLPRVMALRRRAVTA
ncbi:MAG: ATP-binding cassette domain-containing protein [Fimbriimonas sp.]